MEFTAELPEQIHKILHMIFTAYKVYLHRNFLNLLKKLVNHTKIWGGGPRGIIPIHTWGSISK